MSLRRGVLLVLAILGLAVAVLWYWVLHTTSGARWVWSQAQSAAGGQLHAEALEGDLGSGLTLRNPELLSGDIKVSADSLRTRIDVDLLPLQVQVLMLRVDAPSVRMTSGAPQAQSTDRDLDLTGLRLPVRVLFEDVELSEIQVERDGDPLIPTSRLALAASWYDEITVDHMLIDAEEFSLAGNASLQLEHSPEFRAGANGTFRKNRFDARAVGTVDAYDYSGSVTLIETGLGELTAEAKGNGDRESLRAQSLLVAGDAIEASGSAELVWSSELAGFATIDMQTLDLSRVVGDWPAAHPLNGQLRIRASGEEVVVKDSVVRASGLPSVVNLNLSFHRQSAEVSGQIEWRDLAWPVDAPSITSDTGNVQLGGSLDDWQVEGTVAVGTEEMPDGRFTLAGYGDRDSATARIDEGRVLGGAVSGEVNYRWRDAQPWSAELTFAAVQTTDVLSGWPGSLSGDVRARGTSTPFSVTAQLDGVEGDLRGKPVRANGGFAYDGETGHAERLRLQHGSANVALDGSTGTAEGLQFSAQITELGDYTESAAGDVAAEGRYSQLQGELSLEAHSEQLSVAGQAIDELHVSLDYAEASQSLATEGWLLGTRLEVAIAGAFNDWRQPLESNWSGSVERFEIDLADEHAFTLEQTAGLTIAPEMLSLQDFCLQDQTGARLCAELARDSVGTLSLAAVLTRVPAMLSEHFVEHDLEFTQDLSGTIDWRRADNGDTEGQADLQVAAGQVSSSSDTDLVLNTDAGYLRFAVQNRRLLAGDLFVPLPDVGQIDGEFAVLDVREGTASAVTGQANVVMSDISIVANLFPAIDEAGGRLESSVTLAGTVGAPQLTGSLDVMDGEIRYSPIGLHLAEINLHGQLESNRSFRLGGDFRAGDGRGQIVSSAEYGGAEHKGVRFRVEGSDLQLINVPQLQATIAPDFEITFDQQHLGINGSVDVSRARIAPTNLADGRVTESDDVVIVAGELPGERGIDSDEEGLTYSGTLDVTLGDAVAVELDLAKATLGGAVSFEWQGDALPVADGRIDVDGSIEAFGQVLDVSEGVIRFPKVAANNPSIRVRAEREIYGNSQVKRAGVLVDGDVEHPTVEPYTVPMTTEERALTLLVTGSDFDYEQGVGAVDFGTYIAPRLFVSYGIGIFDRDNVISARYDLARGFGIKASSGSKESGFDLNYRFEN